MPQKQKIKWELTSLFELLLARYCIQQRIDPLFVST